jgi:UDP-N-acetylmuramate dehydrogenase
VLDVSDAVLGRHTTLRLGGAARRVVTATDRDEIVQAIRDVAAAEEPLFVLAGGSNVVIGDEGFDGTALLVRSTGVAVRPGGDGTRLVTVEAGEVWDDVVLRCLSDGLAGIESMSGIPGSAGATPIQNVGAYGHEVAEVLESVRVYDRHADRVAVMTADECGLGFRTSVFKGRDRHVVLAVTLRLRESALSAPVRYAELAAALGVPIGGQVPAAQLRGAVLALRAGKGMVLDPTDPDTYSVGSFFKNPLLDDEAHARLRVRAQAALGTDPPAWPYGPGAVKVSAAWLIERAGFRKGYRGGHRGVAISSKHTLALTNRGDGTCAALLGLAREIRQGVRDAFDVLLEPEAVLVGCAL